MKSPDHILETLHVLYSEINTSFCLTLFATPEMTTPIEAFRKAQGIQRI
ncbi:MAG: hypothetical protein P0S93_04335 [Candidatus Neptunochlamydia sp.]|nr:hypothetical protein [Candidatus Neptunochlamydia sp.]